MIELLGKIPRRVVVACSGGVDSMAVLDFLSRNHEVTVAYFNHGTVHGEQAEIFLSDFCKKKNVEFVCDRISSTKRQEQSQEEFWRDERYKFLDKFDAVITGHHLDDVAETWVWSSLHGTCSLIPRERNRVIRPFLLNRKYELESWCAKKNVPFIEDPSNNDTKYTRNLIRQDLMKTVLKVNPGLHTMLKKKLRTR